MARAPFFDKAALGVTQVLRGLDYDTLLERLDHIVVGLSISAEATRHPSGRACAELSANLLARLYPRISLQCPGSTRGVLVGLMRDINPEIEVSDTRSDVEIVIGKGELRADKSYGVAGDGWVAHLSIGQQADDAVWTDDSNVAGAIFAACLGVTAVFQTVFEDLGTVPPKRNLALSTLTFDNDTAYNPSLDVELPETYIAGVGAIGNAALWTLARLPIRGSKRLHLFDPEAVSLSNLQRYILCTLADVGQPKVQVGRKALGNSHLRPLLHATTLSDYLKRRRAFPRVEAMLVSVDSIDARVEAQASLPRVLWNAWTDFNDVGVSRHIFGNGKPCVACLYRNRSRDRSLLDELNESLGLSPPEILTLLADDRPLEEKHVAQIAAHQRVDERALGKWVGSRVMEFREEVICGGVLARIRGAEGGSSAEVQVPLAHQSVLAGVVLALEYVKWAAGLRGDDAPEQFRMPVLKGIPSVLLYRLRREDDARCLCTDTDYLELWNKKWT